MGSLFPKPISVQRLSVSFNHGVPVIDSAASADTVGSLQPFTGKVPEPLVNLKTAKGFIDVYCDDALIVAEPGGDPKGDIVTFDGGRWEVVAKLTHNQGIIDHFHFLASYIGEATP